MGGKTKISLVTPSYATNFNSSVGEKKGTGIKKREPASCGDGTKGAAGAVAAVASFSDTPSSKFFLKDNNKKKKNKRTRKISFANEWLLDTLSFSNQKDLKIFCTSQKWPHIHMPVLLHLHFMWFQSIQINMVKKGSDGIITNIKIGVNYNFLPQLWCKPWKFSNLNYDNTWESGHLLASYTKYWHISLTYSLNLTW